MISSYTIYLKFILSIICIGLLANPLHADEWDIRGHTKYQLRYTDYPSDSLFSQLSFEDTTDQDLDFRLIAENRWDHWDVRIHYQLIALYGDSLEVYRQLPDSPLFASLGIPTDDTRLFDLTHVFVNEGKKALLQRLDRLHPGHGPIRSDIYIE